jgi:hypothetical protein
MRGAMPLFYGSVGEVPLMTLVVRSIAFCFALLLPAAAMAQQGSVEIREYRVLRDGDEIGHHTFTILKDADRTTVNVRTDIAVKIAFITAFRFEHERTEVWEDGKLQSIQSVTNDDGHKYTISGHATDHGFVRNVNGRTDDIANAMAPASFWDRDVILSSRSLFSPVVDATYNVAVSEPDVEELWIDGHEREADHYHMSGDLDYDLWYASDGSPLKIAFKNRGSDIEWILK